MSVSSAPAHQLGLNLTSIQGSRVLTSKLLAPGEASNQVSAIGTVAGFNVKEGAAPNHGFPALPFGTFPTEEGFVAKVDFLTLVIGHLQGLPLLTLAGWHRFRHAVAFRTGKAESPVDNAKWVNLKQRNLNNLLGKFSQWYSIPVGVKL